MNALTTVSLTFLIWITGKGRLPQYIALMSSGETNGDTVDGVPPIPTNPGQPSTDTNNINNSFNLRPLTGNVLADLTNVLVEFVTLGK